MQPITVSRGRGTTIGALSHLTGVNIETIRYYERISLLCGPPRTAGGHRSYEPEQVKQLRFIRRARELGFAINTIRTLLELSVRGPASCAEVRNIAAIHLADVRTKRDDLAKLESILAGTIEQCDAQCCGQSVPLCPVFEILES